jgi:diaminohydroxyphosphoribosylaminopyrimidine deaminase/5-amino-6-(5-phosphoribosylamino)uracil reductase
MAETYDKVYMRRCIELAGRAEGNTSPNPMVGAVVVHDGKIIGEGYHLKAGTPHAEVHALNSVSDRSLLPQSTIYVSLEPCSHHGRTPPCTDLIISSGIRKVVVGTVDTSPKVAGKGIAKMKAAGIEVIMGVEEEACRTINRRFFTWHEKNRPYVILKWARSADGFIDLVRRPEDPAEPHWITGKTERILVHKWRAAEDVILAGGGTIRADDPQLNVRYWRGRDPLKVIVSRSGNIDPHAKVIGGPAEPILFTCNRKLNLPGARIIEIDYKNDFTGDILNILHEMGVQSVFVEGGAFIIGSFLDSGLWDEARRFTGTVSFGGGVPDPFPSMIPDKAFRFAGSTLEITYNH